MEKSKNNAERKKLIIIFGVVALLLCAFLLLYNLSGCNVKTAENIYEFENDSNYQLAEYHGKIFALGYEGVRFLNFNGEQTDYIENHTSSPHYNISGNMILLYDKGDKKLSVYDGVNKKYSYECDQPIKNAKTNKNGYTVLTSDEVAYNSKVLVLDSKGQLVYIWKIGNEYIVDVDIAPDNKSLAAVTISTDTGVIIQNVVLIDIKAAQETGRTRIEGEMPISVKFAESGSAIVVSDTNLRLYDFKAREKWNVSFENNTLQSFEIDSTGNTVVALKGIKNNTIIRTYTKNGGKSGEYITDTNVSYIDVNQRNIAICEESNISVINYSGKVLSTTEIMKNVKGISLAGSDKVLILCDDCIQLIRI